MCIKSRTLWSPLADFRFKTKPLIRTIHGLNRNPAKEKLFSRLKWLLLLIDRILIRFSHSAIAVSDDMFSYLRSFKPASKIIKLYNAINPADYIKHNSSDTILITRKNIRFATISGSVLPPDWPPKNQMIFIEAAHISLSRSQIPSSFYFGEGPLRDELQRIDTLQLSDSFLLHGFVQDIIPVIASFDLFILALSMKDSYGSSGSHGPG